MKRSILLAASLAILGPFAASAQTTEQLVKGASDTSNVLNYGMGYNLQRFSPLTQITKENAKNLVPVWNYSFADDRSEESQPLVYQGVLYVTTHAATMAVNAKTGKQIWKTKVEYPPETPRIVCCGIINRGAAIYEGKLFRTTLDANVIALDANSGKEIWRQKAADIKEGYSMTVAPLVADGVVITGISGAEFGTRGFIDGWDPATGKHLWRTHTIPSPDEPGGDTWKGDTWKLGGGSTWITGSYDPELNTVYWGIGNPGPFNSAVRPGDNLYTCSVLALEPKTGKMKWHYQFSPNNPFDYDSVAEMVLADINVEGKPTKVLMDANRNGFFYVLDRTNGKLLAANPYVNVNWASGVDLKTGRPIETDVSKDAREGKKVVVYPSILGGKNWEPGAFNPKTRMVYIPTQENLCAVMIGRTLDTPVAGRRAATTNQMYIAPGADHISEVQAWNVDTGTKAWTHTFKDSPNWGPMLTTGGGLVFSGGTNDRLFRAYDAKNGKVLWEFPTNSGVLGTPTTFAVGGTQYVAVQSGWGVDARGVNARLNAEYPGEYPEVPDGGAIWVFAVKN